MGKDLFLHVRETTKTLEMRNYINVGIYLENGRQLIIKSYVPGVAQNQSNNVLSWSISDTSAQLL